MDGVLTDFDKALGDVFLNDFNKEHGTNFKNGFDFADEHSDAEMWENVKKGGLEFWSEMSWMPDGKKLWDFLKKYDVEILSAPSRDDDSKKGKRQWCKRELSEDVKVNLEKNKAKFAGTNHILIDDLEKNIKPWKEAGGIGILHTSAADTIKQLNKILENSLQN
jgi:hypothetical protein